MSWLKNLKIAKKLLLINICSLIFIVSSRCCRYLLYESNGTTVENNV